MPDLIKLITIPRAMHNIPIADVVRELGTNVISGLTSDEAAARLKRFGANSIAESKGTSVWIILVRQFKSPIVFLLLFAATLSLIYAKWGDATAILIVLLINAVIGFAMEFKAERSMMSLKSLTKSFGKVVRHGSLHEIPLEQFVPGDILYVEAGDIVSADARIFESSQLQINESALTGESIPVEKSDQVLPADIAVADRSNMLYKGTPVTRGNGKAIVCATGMNTELGKIAEMVERAEDTATPIEKKLEQFSRKLIWITLVLVVIIFLTGIINGKGIIEMLSTVIALSVAAIPEGLPIVATLALAYGMIKMARQNVIVKKLASVETLGGTNIICTDKTGTLTLNKIHVSRGITRLTNDNAVPGPADELLIKAAVLCNTAHIDHRDGADLEVGDPLEVGLLLYARDQGIDIQKLRTDFRKIMEEPFKSETKVMVTLHESPEGKIVFAKGAAEEIINPCSSYFDGEIEKEFSQDIKDQWLRLSEAEASNGNKLIAFAYKNGGDSVENEDLTFVGLTSLIDPPRQEVPDAIRQCHRAGIKVVMITGDHPATAKNVAKQVGIIEHSESAVILGPDMRPFQDLTQQQKEQWKAAPVFARVSPAQKLDLIEVLQEDKKIIAMTGDGVNDAPALKKADIGIAMGLRGTAVAKDVADMVLKDDSFTSIVTAIREGRIIFENIRKFLMFLLSSNLSEIIVIALLFISNLSLIITPLQILFINLLSDVFPALALGFSAGSQGIMNRKPRDPEKPLLSNRQWLSVIVYAVIIAGFTFGAGIISQGGFNISANSAQASTIVFYTLILAQMFHVFSVGDHGVFFFQSDIFRNQYVWGGVSLSIGLGVLAYLIEPVRQALGVAVLDGQSVLLVIGCSLGSFALIQVLKRMNVIH